VHQYQFINKRKKDLLTATGNAVIPVKESAVF